MFQSIPSVPIPPPSGCLSSIPGLHGGAHCGTTKVSCLGLFVAIFSQSRNQWIFSHVIWLCNFRPKQRFSSPFWDSQKMAINDLSSNERCTSWNEQEVEAFLEEEENENPKRQTKRKMISHIHIKDYKKRPYWEKASKPVDRNSINDILAETEEGICGHALYSGNMVSRKNLLTVKPRSTETRLIHPCITNSRLCRPKAHIFSLKLTHIIQTKEILFCPELHIVNPTQRLCIIPSLPVWVAN